MDEKTIRRDGQFAAAVDTLAMGADLQEAKRVCKEDGTLFTAWCESAECPVGYTTAKRLMSVYRELGEEKASAGLFQQGFAVLAEITRTRDEDIRQALLGHIQQKAESGETVTTREIETLKKSLTQAQQQAEEAKDDTLRKMADRIQARAIRRCGELLKQIPSGTGANLRKEADATVSFLNRTEAARQAGLSEHQQVTATRVANVPQAEFEEAVESEKPPTSMTTLVTANFVPP